MTRANALRSAYGVRQDFEPRVLRVALWVILEIGVVARSALLYGRVDGIQWRTKRFVIYPNLLVGRRPRAAHEATRRRAMAPPV